MARLRQAVAALAFLALTFGAQTSLAASPPNASAPTAAPQTAGLPQNAQGGINTLVQPPPIEGQSQPLLFEEYGPLDYAQLTASQGLSDVNVVNDAGNGLAAGAATGMYVLGLIAVRIVEWSFSLNLISQLGPTVDQFTIGLENTLYRRYLPLVLLLAAIIAGWTLLVMRRFLCGLTGLLWAGFVVAVAVQLFAAPSAYLSAADQFSNGVTNAIVVGVAQEDPGAPPGSYEQPGGDANYEVRMLANRLWTVSVYDPWTMIEFGTVDPTVNGDQLGVELLKQNDGQPNSYNQDLSQAPQWIQLWADGNWGMPRAVFGFFMALLSGILLIFILLIALTVIVGTLAAIVLACLSVPVWLLAPIPGFGQRLLVSWFGGIVAGLAVSAVGALYLVLVLALLGAVAVLVGTVGLITVGLLDVGLIVIAVWLRKTFFNFGRHVSRLPLALAAGQRPQAAPPRVEETGKVSHVAHRQISKGRQRAAAPINIYTRRQVLTADGGKAGVAKSGAATGAAAAVNGGARAAVTKGTGSTAAASGVSFATAGAAVVALGAMKAGQGVLRLHDFGRRRTQATVANALGAPASPGQVPLRHAAGGEPSVLMSAGRVTSGGVKAWRARRVHIAEDKKSLPPGRMSSDGTTQQTPVRRVKPKTRAPRLEPPKR